jgi:uncharacterized membrane protein YbhN (UPF0104 family)
MTLGTIMGNASLFVPIPGKSGLVEYFSQAIYGSIVNANAAAFGIAGLSGAAYDTAVIDKSAQIVFLDRLPYYIKLSGLSVFFASYISYITISGKKI